MYLKVNLDMKCSDQEKNEMLKLIETICDVADKARCGGLLSIMDEYKNIDNVLLKSALELMIMGFDHDALMENFNYLIFSANFDGRQLLERCIIYEAVLWIYSGCKKEEIKLLLLSMLGEKWVNEALFPTVKA